MYSSIEKIFTLFNNCYVYLVVNTKVKTRRFTRPPQFSSFFGYIKISFLNFNMH